jgi:DNA repair protein RecO (recombination protein O)
LELVVEVLEEALPELAVEDNVFRLAVAALRGMEGSGNREQGIGNSEQGKTLVGREVNGSRADGAWEAVTYFCVWMARLMGWWPELGHCAVCGLHLADQDLRGREVWWSPVADGVTCADDRRPQSRRLSAEAVAESHWMARMSLEQFAGERQRGRQMFRELGAFAVAVLERHLQRRLRSAAALE